MRGVSLCLGEQVLDAARSQSGKGAVHQLRVSHSCEMQMERHLPPSLHGRGRQVSGFLCSYKYCRGLLKQAFY